MFVIINVLDQNDNPPQFPKDTYHFTVREDVAKPGYIVTDQLNVKDGDKNVRSSNSFSLLLLRSSQLSMVLHFACSCCSLIDFM